MGLLSSDTDSRDEASENVRFLATSQCQEVARHSRFPSAPRQPETPTAIEITLPADVLFDFDKAELRTDVVDEALSGARSALHDALTSPAN